MQVGGVVAGETGFEAGGKTGGVEGLHAGEEQVLLVAEMAEEGDFVDTRRLQRCGGWIACV